MADRPKGYGFTADVRKKISNKYDENLAQEAMEWITHYVIEADVLGEYDEVSIHNKLKDGQVLCRLMNALESGCIRKINESEMAFKKMENIGNFLSAAEKFGLNPADSFQTVDLYEKQNMASVISTIHALGRKAQSKGLNGIGPKESEKNKREFTEEQRKAGESIIGLQMGSNKGATQSGQNFGKTRAIID